MMKLTPAVRLALGLVFLTLSILVVAQSLGLLPNPERELLAARERITETLALQTTLAVRRNDQAMIRQLYDTTVTRDDTIVSIGLQKASGTAVYQTVAHDELWQLPPGAPSTTEFMRLPINVNAQQQGVLEVAFTPLAKQGRHWLGVPHFVLLLVFITGSGFFAFWAYIKRVLHHLDPSSVVPTRVRNALNIMAEGVMILDKREQVVLANETLTALVNMPEQKLLGRKASELGFHTAGTDCAPWQLAQTTGAKQVNLRMTLVTEGDTTLVFRVNAIPITDGRGGSQGVIASFDNVTELEEKNSLLKQMVKNLAEKQQAIEVKNQELHHLASRDPLTNCFNRRTLFDYLGDHFAQGKHLTEEMCVIMADIDHFKNINDTYGHNFGDETIQSIAAILRSHTRDGDLVARFGGEEFCILMPHTTLNTAVAVADRCRKAIAGKPLKNVPVTASFGIASSKCGAASPTALIHLADQALYKSKDDGRNRCTMWSPFLSRSKTNASG